MIAVAGVYDQQNALAVYNANGTPDSAVGTKGVAVLNSLNISDGTYTQFQSDGHLIEVQAGGSPMSVTLNRFDADGTPDTTFGTGGQAVLTASSFPPNPNFQSVGVNQSGRILLVGYYNVPGLNGKPKSLGFLTRITSTGALDTSFGNGGSVSQDFGSYGNPYAELAVYPVGTVHAGELLALGENQTQPYPSPYDELALALYQSDTTAASTSVSTTSTVASPTHTATAISTPGAGRYDPEIAPLVLDSPDFFDTLGIKRRTRPT